MIFRAETEDDYARIYEVNRQAFERAAEGRLVNMLRASEHYVPGLSLVAVNDGRVTVSRLRISSHQVLQRFRHFNRGRQKRDRVKPFNFMMVGTGHMVDPETGKFIIPVRPFTPHKNEEFKWIQHETFVDLNSGKI